MNRESRVGADNTKTIVLASFFSFENISTPHEAIFNDWKMLEQGTANPIWSVIYDCYFYAERNKIAPRSCVRDLWAGCLAENRSLIWITAASSEVLLSPNVQSWLLALNVVKCGVVGQSKAAPGLYLAPQEGGHSLTLWYFELESFGQVRCCV